MFFRINIPLIINVAFALVLWGIGYELGYMHGSYLKNRDLELSYQDGYINGAEIFREGRK